MFKKAFLYFLAILYISDIPFFFLPFNVRTRFFLGIVGIIIFFVKYVKELKFHKFVWNNICWLLALLLPFTFTILVNNHFDAWGFRAILNVFVFFAAFWIVYLFKYQKFEEVLRMLINIILINIFIAIMMFIFTPIKDFFFRLQGQGIELTDALYYVSTFRLYGIGNFFFYQAGVFCSWGLIIVTYFLKKEFSYRWVFVYVTILFSGIFFARTALLGFIFSLVYYFLPSKMTAQEVNRRLKIMFISFFLGGIGILFLFAAFRNLLLENSDVPMVAHAFEFFLNFYTRGEFSSNSTDQLAEMYVYPETIKTWLIGDGKFTADDGIHYYMETDVGYLRVLFFMGLMGLFILYTQKIYLLYTTFKLKVLEKNEFKQLIVFLFGLTLVLNFKGFTDLDLFVFLFFWQLLLFKETIDDKLICDNSKI